MKKRFILSFLVFTCALGLTSPVYGSKSKPFSCQEEADQYLKAHYKQACHYYRQGEWRLASDEFEKVIYFFPASEEAIQASYYLGVCYFEMKEYDFANTEFSNYIKASVQAAFFEEAVNYKFCIAEHFKNGKRRRPFKMRYFPKWISGQSLALTIYDEVTVALPNHELTVSSLYAKADLLQAMGNYWEAVDTYQILIRRFPKHEGVPICYLKIAEAYCQQSTHEFQNPDILALAELNAKKFKEEFPRDERVELADGYVCRIKEMYAKGLCDLGLFYERKGKPAAAAIYYQSSIEEFPDTKIAEFCRSRLLRLGHRNQEEALEESFFLVEEESSLQGEESAVVDQPMMSSEQPLLISTDQSVYENPCQENVLVEEQSVAVDQPIMHMEQPPFMETDQAPSDSKWAVEEENAAKLTPYFNQPPTEPEWAVQEEVEAEPAPYFIHYSLLKKREVERRDKKARRYND